MQKRVKDGRGAGGRSEPVAALTKPPDSLTRRGTPVFFNIYSKNLDSLIDYSYESCISKRTQSLRRRKAAF